MIVNITAISILAAYLIAPAVQYLHEKGVSKTTAIVIVYMLIACLISFSISYLLPVIKMEFQRLLDNMNGMSLNLNVLIATWTEKFQNYLPQSLAKYLDPEKLKVQNFVKYAQKEVPGLVSNSMPGVMNGVRSMASVITGAILVPLLVFYILMDTQVYKESFIGCLPKTWRVNAVDLLRRIDYVLGKFIRGQLIVCVTIGFFVGLSLWLMGIDYAILIGIFSGIVDIIPYVGVGISYIPAFLIALLNKGPLFAIFTILILQAVHWLEGHIVVPAVIGRSINIPPLIIMVALIAGAEIGGIMGMLLAIPITAILRVILEFYVEKHPSFGPLAPEELNPQLAPYPNDPNAIVPAKESVKQIVGKVNDFKSKHLNRGKDKKKDEDKKK